MALEVESIDSLVGTPVPYAYAVGAGLRMFLSGDAQETKPAPSSDWTPE